MSQLPLRQFLRQRAQLSCESAAVRYGPSRAADAADVRLDGADDWRRWRCGSGARRRGRLDITIVRQRLRQQYRLSSARWPSRAGHVLLRQQLLVHNRMPASIWRWFLPVHISAQCLIIAPEGAKSSAESPAAAARRAAHDAVIHTHVGSGARRCQ